MRRVHLSASFQGDGRLRVRAHYPVNEPEHFSVYVEGATFSSKLVCDEWIRLVQPALDSMHGPRKLLRRMSAIVRRYNTASAEFRPDYAALKHARKIRLALREEEKKARRMARINGAVAL